MSLPPFIDLQTLSEDERIALIAQSVKQGARVGFMVDDTPGKAQRYVNKLKAHVPSVVVETERALARGVLLLRAHLPDCDKSEKNDAGQHANDEPAV